MVRKNEDGSYENTNIQISFDYGTIERHSTNRGFDFYQIRGDDNGQQLFEFFANNTHVEWSWFECGIAGNKGLNFLTSSGDTEFDGGAPKLINQQLKFGYTVRSHTHNHPSSRLNIVPSGIPNVGKKGEGDIGFVKNTLSQCKGSPKTYIYTNGGGYNPYTASSTIEDYKDKGYFINKKGEVVYIPPI